MTSLAVLQEHYEEPYHRGDCENATHAAEAACEETGCQIRFELCLLEVGKLSDEDSPAAENILQEIWWDGQGCVYCEGFASFLSGELEGKRWEGSAANEILERTQGNLVESPTCLELIPQLLLAAVESSQQEDDWSEAGEFGGPSLGEEC
ncbi:MAG: hypothetical protein VXZ82_00415 [Planctomycetota bacterium]|nr:hypothetical protein [Planctomycetota bacterium]